MKTTAVRLYGKNDLRLESFELPEIREDEILAKIITDSLCMSSYKAAVQGADHKRVPDDVHENPIIIGHEFCGELVQVGRKWRDKFAPGEKFSIQPAINEPSNVYAAPGYTFKYIGGDATYIIIPAVVMEHDCLLGFDGNAFYLGSLAEPVSCVIGGFNVNYHTKAGSYVHQMGIREGGNMALLAGAGPMGLGAIDYAIHGDRHPSLLVVTDIDEERLSRAARLYTAEDARKQGVTLKYINTSGFSDVPAELMALTKDGCGFDDVFVYAPVAAVAEQASAILGYDGCMNFFAGPTNPNFTARLNLYDVHYNAAHFAGNSGGNTDDMRLALSMMEEDKLNPASMVTHIGGLDAVIPTTLDLPNIPGGKKLIYTQLSLPLTALAEAEKISPELSAIIERHSGLWSAEAESWLMTNGTQIKN